ncbi:MAG: hypothetical protein ACQEQF_05545 [Bacillota bacterium]
MFLFEYLIKLLMGNSDALFIGLLVVLFGYYGWLLWNQNNSYKDFYNKWEKHNENFVEVRKIVYNLDSKITKLENLDSKLDNISNNLDKSRIDILKETEEESEEIKEIVKILLGHYRKMQKNDK